MSRYHEYTFKVIRTGKITEIYAYEDILYHKISADTISKENTLSAIEELALQSQQMEEVTKVEKVTAENVEYFRRKSDIALTTKKLKRLLYANIGQYKEKDKFLTLTFAKYPDRETVINEFDLFKRRFKYLYENKFEYVAVIERGTQGTKRLHIHMVVFDLPYIKQKELAKIWKNGHVYVNAVEDLGDVPTYMTKYIDKTLEDGYIQKGQRFYFPSKGLKKPDVLFLNDIEIRDFMEQVDIGESLYDFAFSNPYIGNCFYQKYVKTI